MTRANCPSCGAPIEFASKVSLYAVCAYCGSLLLRKDLDVEKVGEVAELQEDSTPLRIGTKGRHEGRPFEILGRIQLRFPSGYWNEWYLTFGGDRDGWLGEAQGLYAVMHRVDPLSPPPPFDALRVGERVRLANETFRVRDIQRARCIGGEGELPFRVDSGYEAPVVDLGTPGRRVATLDYSESPPLLFVGDYATFDELHLTNLRELEGW